MGERSRFVVQLAKSRWLVVVAAIWIQCFSGATYTFGIYSPTIKDTFNYDQKSLGILASWKDLGANVGIVSGLVFDWFSPRIALAIGALQSGIAFLLMWLSVTGRIATPEFWQMCLYILVAANSQTFLSTASVVTCVQNFPRNRGVVIGMLKGNLTNVNVPVIQGLLGLSGAILTQFYHAAYGNDPSSYLFMLVWLPTVITLLLMVIVRPVPAREEIYESKYLYWISTIAVSLAAFLMGVIILESMTSISHFGHVAVCLVIGGLLVLPLGVVLKSELKESALSSLPSLKEPLVMNSGDQPSSLSSSVAVPKPEDVRDEREQDSQRTRSTTDSEVSEESDKPRSIVTVPEQGYLLKVQLAVREGPSMGEDHSILEAMAKLDFWLLFLAMACGMGSGLTSIDNTAQIGGSLGYNPEQVGMFISLFSIWNFLGRLGFGAVSEWCLHKYKMSRTVLLASSQGFMALGYIMMISAIPGCLYPALTIIGLCYGAQWSLMPAITSEIFGLSRFATLFNTISIASPIGAYLLSVQVAGRLYDAEAKKDNHPLNSDDVLECSGAHCFRLTFIILAAVSGFGCTVCVLLVHRTKRFYSRVLQNSVVR